MNLWPFNRKSREQALVEFAGFHVLCNVRRDADDRPFVLICGNAIRLDDPAVIEQRNVIWIKRRADEPPAQSSNSRLAELKQFYAEIVECDGGRESGQMELTRWAIEEIERLQRELADARADLEEMFLCGLW